MPITEEQILKSLWQSHGALVEKLGATRHGLCKSFALMRKERGLSFREAAELANVDMSNLSKFEKGRWSMAMADKLYKVYFG